MRNGNCNSNSVDDKSIVIINVVEINVSLWWNLQTIYKLVPNEGLMRNTNSYVQLCKCRNYSLIDVKIKISHTTSQR